MSNFIDVGDFHKKFGLDNVTHRPVGPRDTSPELMEFRIKFMHEELREFEDACAENDDAKMLDALIDLVYVAMGTAHLRGYPWQAAWSEVHRANMTKIRAAIDGSDSVRASAWDVVKPPGWVAPRIDDILRRYSSTWTTTPKKCPQCQRNLDEVTLKEVVVRWPTPRVDIHCPCGRHLRSRVV